MNSKERLIELLRFLFRQTDERHPVSTNDIIDHFKSMGEVIDRKTVKQDIDMLTRLGYDIITVRRTHNAYFVGSRLFELAEIKLLIDAVESSKFITTKKSVELAKKLVSLVSVHQAVDLKRHVYIADRVKPQNEQIYYLIDSINTAINEKRQISFLYFEYDANREKVLRNDGKPYLLSPYGLVWNEDNYYAVGYSEKHEKIVTFRVDRMVSVQIADIPAIPAALDFNLAEYARQVFDMYDGKTETVSLKCANRIMKAILDRFGDNVRTEPIDSETFRADMEVSVSQTFFGWVFQFGGDIKIIGPQKVVKQYTRLLQEAMK